MKRWIGRLIAAFGVVLLGAAGASACEEYKSLSTQEMKDFRDKLAEDGADPLDRLFAFEELSCSENPTIRAYAIRQGLSSATDPLVRQQIAFTAIMQKMRIDIELVAGNSATEKDKKFIKEHSGLYSLEVRHRSEKDGCLGFWNTDECLARYSLVLKGDKAEFRYDKTIGEFILSDDNVLAGFIRVRADEDYSRIPAVIKLF
ncbi:hypothetical protein AB2N04_03920 [Nitratireductor sp. GISD-1A_MAKvit]|uniref:hypothetical protein n=1 Tax=Nitratireductor sp. GISD-1A_MAKvit TaxID=3234198 RepID=UPI0034678803